MSTSLKIRPRSNWRRHLVMLLALSMILGGFYILVSSSTPWIQSHLIDPVNNSTSRLLAASSEQKITENRLYIPKIDINLPYNTGNAEVMEHGAWWRQPNNGNPRDGGNFVLSAHRFIMGLTPEQTLRKSPFYNINRLQIGDEITVDFDGKRYIYTISEIFKVKPEDVHIENRTAQPRLTLYSCTLGGAQDGREVFIATPKS